MCKNGLGSVSQATVSFLSEEIARVQKKTNFRALDLPVMPTVMSTLVRHWSCKIHLFNERTSCSRGWVYGSGGGDGGVQLGTWAGVNSGPAPPQADTAALRFHVEELACHRHQRGRLRPFRDR